MSQPEPLEILEQRFEQSISVPAQFFEAQAAEISRACLRMARAFHQGGRLLVFGMGGAATDAQHVAVEFVHPVIVGKRALPAIALNNDVATLTGVLEAQQPEDIFALLLQHLARPYDMAMGISWDGNTAPVVAGLQAAQKLGLLTLGLAGAGGGAFPQLGLDFCFIVPTADPLVIQETHETLYHVLWELVHVFFEHQGLLQ